MERHENRTYLLFAYHHDVTTILQQLSSFVDQKKPTTTHRPLQIVTYHLQHLYTFYGYCLSFATPQKPMSFMPIVYINFPFP